MFYKSTRFWALVLFAGVGILQNYAMLPAEVSLALLTVLGGHIGIRTVDRFSEEVGKK